MSIGQQLGNAPSYICRLLAACRHAALRLCLATVTAKSTCTGAGITTAAAIHINAK